MRQLILIAFITLTSSTVYAKNVPQASFTLSQVLNGGGSHITPTRSNQFDQNLRLNRKRWDDRYDTIINPYAQAKPISQGVVPRTYTTQTKSD